MIVFDIETGPLAEEQLRQQFTEPELPAHPGEFQESAVKLGNLKDAVKIREKIEAARQAHEASVTGYAAECERVKVEAWKEFVGRAALSPLTGRILVIGYHSTDKGVSLLDDGQGEESAIVEHFWSRYDSCRRDKRLLVGHNIAGFDVPFICRRSWLLGIDVPTTVFERGRWLDSLTFSDTMQIWSCGTRDPWAGLDALSKAMGGEGKPVGQDGQKVDGGMFAELWRTDRPRAEEYLRNDLAMTVRVAERLGLI